MLSPLAPPCVGDAMHIVCASDMNTVKLVIPLHFIALKQTPNDAVTPQRQSQFTPKMKANAVPRLLSSLVWNDQYNECNGMTIKFHGIHVLFVNMQQTVRNLFAWGWFSTYLLRQLVIQDRSTKTFGLGNLYRWIYIIATCSKLHKQFFCHFTLKRCRLTDNHWCQYNPSNTWFLFLASVLYFDRSIIKLRNILW